MGTHSALDKAISSYIAGDYEHALQQLEPLTQRLQNGDLSQAYLYMGRCYLALGQYKKAGNAFTLGRSTGGEGPFDEYLMQVRYMLLASPKNLYNEGSITRAQLACLFAEYFGDTPLMVLLDPAAPSTLKRTEREPEDIDGHWAHPVITHILSSGLMQVMPDGRFYPDEMVSRPAFLFMVAGTIEELNIGSGFNASFPSGVEGELSRMTRVTFDGINEKMISGREAVEVLQHLALEAGILNE